MKAEAPSVPVSFKRLEFPRPRAKWCQASKLDIKMDLSQVPFATMVFKDNLRILYYCGCFRVIMSLKPVALQDLSTRSVWLLCERPVPAPGSVVWPPGPQGCASSWAQSQGSGWDPVGLAVMGLLGPFFRISSEALPVVLLKQESTGHVLIICPWVFIRLVYEKGVPLILCGGSLSLKPGRTQCYWSFKCPELGLPLEKVNLKKSKLKLI